MFDEPELIVIKLIVSFVSTEQLLLTPFTKHDTAELNDADFIKFSQVYILREEPISVANEGVTVNFNILNGLATELEEVSLLAYPWLPVNR